MSDGLQLEIMRTAQHVRYRRLAERLDELDTVWPAPYWRSWYQQVGDRLALFEACRERSGRPEYHGGEVPTW